MNTEFQGREGLTKPLSMGFADKLQSWGVSPKKALEYAIMLTVLTVVYYCYFLHDARIAQQCPGPETISLSELGLRMLKFLALTAWPFALMAAYDSEWRSKDGGNVFLAAYIFTNVLWYEKTHCGFCIFAASMRIVPYAICACIAHGLGELRHHWSRSE